MMCIFDGSSGLADGTPVGGNPVAVAKGGTDVGGTATAPRASAGGRASLTGAGLRAAHPASATNSATVQNRYKTFSMFGMFLNSFVNTFIGAFKNYSYYTIPETSGTKRTSCTVFSIKPSSVRSIT
jgi:hypothetical protein